MKLSTRKNPNSNLLYSYLTRLTTYSFLVEFQPKQIKELNSLFHSLRSRTSTMVKQTTSVVLFGQKITTVTETSTSSGEESTAKKTYYVLDKNCFKHRGETSTVKNPETIEYYWINPILEFPSTIKNAIDRAGGHDFVFLLGMEVARLFALVNNVRWFYIPKTEWLMNYLTEEEKREIVKEGFHGGLSVLGFDAMAETKNFKLILWPDTALNMTEEKKREYLVWKKKWAKLVGDNGPDKSTVLELWCFRDDRGVLRVAVNTEKRAFFGPRSTGGRGGVRIGGGIVD